MHSRSVAPAVVCHVQASAHAGMGHLARTSALMRSLDERGIVSVLHLDADERGTTEAEVRGHPVTYDLPRPPAALILDGVRLPASLLARANDYYPRILISPVCDQAYVATHVLVRDAPLALRSALSLETVLITDPDFAFVTAGNFRPKKRDIETVRVGICLSGADDTFGLDRLVQAVADSSIVAEIRIIDRRRPSLESVAGIEIRRVSSVRAPWDFMAGINCFVGGDGVMAAEAISQGIPAFALSTGQRMEKNWALQATGALHIIERIPFDSAELTRCLSDKGMLERMHKAAIRVNGGVRAEKLANRVAELLR